MKSFLVLIFIGLFTLSGCSRSAQEEETYLLEQAQHQINAYKYSDALSTLAKLDQNKPQVISLTASALAGRAGFNTLSLADLITTNKGDPSVALLLSLNANYQAQDINDIYRATQLLNSQDDFASRLQYASLQVYKVSQIILKNYTHQDQLKLCSEESVIAANEIIDIIISLNLSIIKVQEIVTNIYDYVQQLQKDLGVNPSQLNRVQITDEDVEKVRAALSAQIHSTLNTTLDLCEIN
jgi:hypothetical protein